VGKEEVLMITTTMTGMAAIAGTLLLLQVDIPKTTDILIHIAKIKTDITMITIKKIEDRTMIEETRR
jgi:hypothetical protein